MLRGTRVGQAYVAVTADGDGINESIVDAVDEAGNEIDGKGTEVGENYGDEFSDGFLSRMRSKIGQRFTEAIDARRIGGDAGDEVGESFVDRMGDKLRGVGDKISAELSDRIASNPEQVRRGIDRAFDDDFADRIGDRLGSRIVEGMSEAIDRQSGVLGAALSEALDGAVSGNGGGGRGGKRGGIGDVIGRMFGAGSRNNFLNLLGKSIGGIVGLVDKASGFASTFASNMSKAGDSASLLSRVMAGFGGGGGGAGLLRLGAALPTLLIGFGAVTVAVIAVTSILSAMLAVVTALAATITSALVGALAVGAGAFGALAVSIGLVTLAFTSMTNAQSDALSRAFQPLKAAATGLGQIMLREMVPAFETWSNNLQVALSFAAPLAEVMGGAFARAGNILTAAFSGPGVQMLITMLAQTLPGIVTNLSRAFGGFLNGVSGVFAALLPTVLQFAQYLSRVASDFSRWATSTGGQNSIKDFIDRAVKSLKSFWDFLKAVGSLISTVLFNPKGQRTGNSIFESMANGVRRFTDYISEEDRLEKWFEQGRKFARTLGKAIEMIGKALAWLEQPWVVNGLQSFVGALESAFKFAGEVADAIGWVEDKLDSLFGRLEGVGGEVSVVADESWRAADNLSKWQVPGTLTSQLTNLANQFTAVSHAAGTMGPFIDPSLPDVGPTPGSQASTLANLINSGNNALNNTYESNGGYLPDPTKADKGPKFTQFEGGPATEWMNPYANMPQIMIDAAAQLAEDIRKSAREARRSIADALNDSIKSFASLLTEFGKSFIEGVNGAVESTDYKAIGDSFASIIEQSATAVNAAIDQATTEAQNMFQSALAANDQMVASARAAVDAARQRLAGASSPKEVKAAKDELNRAEQNLALAVNKGREVIANAQIAGQQLIANAQASVNSVARANAILAGQSVYTYENALNLARGLTVENATLADFAEARRWASERLAEANQKLAEAIGIRDNYATAVADSIRNFGSLLNAQAKVINGVQQALTATDITDSMSERLERVKVFQENLRQLLALGLSNEAYKQIVDAGVENGGAYAEALLKGGQGSISETNRLTDEFGKIAKDLGLAASNQLYQAGVDAAQGLVDGLLSLSEQLDSAAAALGASIAAAIKRELGIASPSRVLMAMMDDVGDGAVVGLDNQHGKVADASARLSQQIAVSPEVAAYAASQNTSPTVVESEAVSGNADGTAYAGRIRDLIIHTPTEDPHAVATEVLDEIVETL